MSGLLPPWDPDAVRLAYRRSMTIEHSAKEVKNVRCKSCHCEVDVEQFVTEYLAAMRTKSLDEDGSIPDLVEVSKPEPRRSRLKTASRSKCLSEGAVVRLSYANQLQIPCQVQLPKSKVESLKAKVARTCLYEKAEELHQLEKWREIQAKLESKLALFTSQESGSKLGATGSKLSTKMDQLEVRDRLSKLSHNSGTKLLEVGHRFHSEMDKSRIKLKDIKQKIDVNESVVKLQELKPKKSMDKARNVTCHKLKDIKFKSKDKTVKWKHAALTKVTKLNDKAGSTLLYTCIHIQINQ